MLFLFGCQTLNSNSSKRGPSTYEIKDSYKAGHVFEVNGKQFTQTKEFISWVSSLAPGTILIWDSGCDFYSELPLAGDRITMKGFKSICTKYDIEFDWRCGQRGF
jgi:hypothetical protein